MLWLVLAHKISGSFSDKDTDCGHSYQRNLSNFTLELIANWSQLDSKACVCDTCKPKSGSAVITIKGREILSKKNPH